VFHAKRIDKSRAAAAERAEADNFRGGGLTTDLLMAERSNGFDNSR